MKKILTIVFAILSMCCLFSIVISAVDINGVDYTLTESASGNTAIVSTENKKMQTENVVIPQTVSYDGKSYTVTTIARQAFEANTSIKTLVIEADLGATGLKGYAFSQCSNLRQVSLPNSLTVIPERCFKQCTSLVEITLPSNLQELGSCAFWKCTGLTSVDVPASVTVVSDKVFEECTALKTVKSAAPVIGERMFWNCKAVESAIFTNTVSIKKCAFHYFGVKNGTGVVVLPDTLTTVESNAFEYCYFNTVILPKSITNVAENGFIYLKNYCKSIKFTGTDEQASKLFSSYGISYELVNHCEIYYNNNHAQDTNPCLIECTRCGLSEQDPNAVHSFKKTIAYANGYSAVGTITAVCENEGCQYRTTPTVDDVEPIFVQLGYAMNEAGTALTAGYMVNEEEYNQYVAQDGVSLSYGVVAYAPDAGKTTCNPLYAENGEIKALDADYTIYADLTENACKVFDFVITGFDNAQSVTLAVCAYAYNGSELVYLCSENGVLTQFDNAQAITVYNAQITKAVVPEEVA